MQQELVKNNMVKDVIGIAADTSLPDAHKVMKDHNIRRLPVVDGDKVLGIVSLSDVRDATPSGATTLSIWELNYLIAKLTVDEIMTKTPITISEDANIADAATIMLEKKIGGIPVVDSNEKLTGIITESDIFRLVVRNWQ